MSSLDSRMSRRQQSGSYTVPPPLASAPERLPLGDPELPWSRFEAFCRDLISRLPGTTLCYHYGQQGNPQRGIDLIAERMDGEHWSYQCKQYRSYSKAQAEKAIQTTTYSADKYHLCVSCE